MATKPDVAANQESTKASEAREKAVQLLRQDRQARTQRCVEGLAQLLKDNSCRLSILEVRRDGRAEGIRVEFVPLD